MIYLLKPVPRKAIWGKTLLRDTFGFNDFPDGIGQSWSFSAQEGEGKANLILSGDYKGKTLLDLWNDKPEVFNTSASHFPFIIGLVAPEDDLSIQIHPNAEIAKKHGLLSGKNEAWYFIDAKENSDIVFDQKAKNLDELNEYINEKRWNDLLKHRSVKKDDFVYIPAGTLHAMKKELITYEVQEATDVTYRFYDYDRRDDEGKLRELHLNEAIESMTFNDIETLPDPQIEILHNSVLTTYINNESFCIRKLVVDEKTSFSTTQYQCMNIIRGSGLVDNHPVKPGDAFLVPANTQNLEIIGNLEIMMTSETSI